VEGIDFANLEKLQHAYIACLNETVIDDLGPNPLLPILYNVTGKYPAESRCNRTGFSASVDSFNFSVNNSDCSRSGDSLTDVILYLQSIGVGALFRLDVDVRRGFWQI
jgi:hypothetical protein